MKKIISLLLSVLLIVTLLAACAAEEPAGGEPAYETPVTLPAEIERLEDTDRLSIITTIFPQYDFIRQIAGDRVNLQMLLSPGAEAHSFEPSPQDMIALLEADLFVYIGGHGEAWVDTILGAMDSDSLTIVALLDMIDDLLAGEHDHEHGHGHDTCDDNHHHHHDDCDDDDVCDSSDHHHHHDDCDDDDTCDDDHHHHSDTCDDHSDACDDNHDYHYDEHVWTSPRNAIYIVKGLTAILSDLDPDNAQYFAANAAAYIQELEDLDQAFRHVVAEGVRTAIVFGDRNPFRYLAAHYGLTYHAAFDGCSTETQANPQTIARLIELMDSEGIPVVFYIEFSNQLIADVLVEATGAEKLEFHSTHNLSYADFNAGVTYLELMHRNVEQLRQALN
ncbi:MAG: metal ABC transporter substrate-binding protein [Oscillospiraceae bacterium]|nr:metal ABC transporter substrate-binding protein [Oscillospiraceae bacterium]